jgi:alkanesulfonate monooxygenase SsuD/methylene tetrahydromethanopterin reductase-like flavin-dependent oxidoreductase (luciferase family)
MKRIGFATGYDKELTVPEMAHWVEEAERTGFEIGFFSETIALMRDSVSAIANFASSTERILLGFTQIVRLRSPVIMAQTLATLDELSDGRIILAPGACTRAHAQVHSLEHMDPVLTLTEWVQALRLMLTQETATYRGQSVEINNIGFNWRQNRRRIPFWNAATSQTGLRLAARIGDGVILNAVTSPAYSANAIRILREVIEDQGRDWDNFEVAQLINCSLEEERDLAFDKIRWEIASKFHPRQAPFNAGPRMRVGEPFIRAEDLPRFEKAFQEGGMPRLIHSIPDSYIEGLTASGTPTEVQDRIEQYRAAGVKLPILRPAAADQTARILRIFGPRVA